MIGEDNGDDTSAVGRYRTSENDWYQMFFVFANKTL